MSISDARSAARPFFGARAFLSGVVSAIALCWSGAAPAQNVTVRITNDAIPVYNGLSESNKAKLRSSAQDLGNATSPAARNKAQAGITAACPDCSVSRNGAAVQIDAGGAEFDSAMPSVRPIKPQIPTCPPGTRREGATCVVF